MVKVGSVIQVKGHVPAWGGCLMIVDDVMVGGVRAHMRLPGREHEMVELLLNRGEYYYIGESKGEI